MTGEIAGLYRPGVIMWLIVFLIAHSTHSAPVYDEDTTQVAEYEGAAPGCYYNFQYYEEGDRIMTNEPCLNCTCHNRMLMCYLRVCPQFTKAIGQNCQVEKRPDQCCPVITCPEVPVHLLTSTTSAPLSSSSSDSTEVGFHDNYGCSINNKFYADGAQLPSTDPNNPCELCYCIRNRTTCTMLQCTLKIARCKPVNLPGICCPVKYDCDYDEEPATTPGTTPGLIMTTTMAPGIASAKCTYQGKLFNDGELLYSTAPCHHCYCFNGDIACAVQECGKPMEAHGKNCTALPPPEGECCPSTYECENESGSIEGEEQQKVTHDENEIVATQATLPVDQVDEEEQKHEGFFPGADNAIPEDNQVHEEITLGSVEAGPTTEAAVTKIQPPESTIMLETDGMTEKETPSPHIPEDNAVPQEPVQSVMHVDETTQSTEEFKPTESGLSTESVEHEKLTTIIEEVEATKSPASEKPDVQRPETVTDTPIVSSDKPSTNLPARSEDQFPVEPPVVQPEEISTHFPRSENESTEIPPVTVPVTSGADKKPEEEEKSVTTIPESNEIPKVAEVPKEPTAAPEGTTITSSVDDMVEKRPEEVQSETSIPVTPETSEETKPITDLPKTEVSEGAGGDATVHPTGISEIPNRIHEQGSTSASEDEEKPEEAATTLPTAEHTSPTHGEPPTEAIESDMHEVPTQGPSGIAVPTRGPVTKAEDNESAPEGHITESYEELPGAGQTQTPENLMTEKPEVPVEVLSEAGVTGEEKITEKPQVPAEEPAIALTESQTTKPEDQTSSEHIPHIPQTPEVTQATELPIEHEELSTVTASSEEPPATQSTGITEVEMPMKGIEVSGEQSSEEAASSGAPTTEEKQPDSSESSSEEEGEEPGNALTPTEHPSSTELSSATGSEMVAEGQVTGAPEEKDMIVPVEHEPLPEEKPTETSTKAVPGEEKQVAEGSTEKSTGMPPTEERPTEKSTIEEPVKEKPVEEGPTEKYPVEQTTDMPAGVAPTEKSTEETSLEGKPTEIPKLEKPAEEQLTEKSTEEPSLEEKPMATSTEEQPVKEKSSEEQLTTEKSSEEQPTTDKPSEEQPTTEKSSEEQPTTDKPSEEQPTTEKSSEEQPTTDKPSEEQPTTDKPSEEQPATEKPSEEQPTTEKPSEKQPTQENPTKGKPVERKPIDEKQEPETPTEQEGTESEKGSQTTEAHSPTTVESQTELPHEEPVTDGVKVETPSTTESAPTSLPAETEQTEKTIITDEITKPSVTFAPQESSTELIQPHTTSEEDASQSTELPVIDEDITEKEVSEQPAIEVKPEVNPEEAVNPSENPIPVFGQTESSITEQSSTESETSSESEKPQTEQPIVQGETKPSEASVPEERPYEESTVMSADVPKSETGQEGQTTSEIELESQTTKVVTESAVTEEVSTQESEIEKEVQQTPSPSIISVDTTEATTGDKSTEGPISIESAVAEKKPNEETVISSTETIKPEDKLSEESETSPTETQKPGEKPSEEPVTTSSETRTPEAEPGEVPVTSAIETIKPEENPSEAPVTSPIETVTPEENPSEAPVTSSTETVEPEKKPSEESVTSPIETVKLEDNPSEAPDTSSTELVKPEKKPSEESVTSPIETVELEENPSEAPVTSSIETVKPEEKPSEEPMTSTTETVKLEENPSEAPVTSSIETVKPEEKPSEEPMTPTTETVKLEENPSEAPVTSSIETVKPEEKPSEEPMTPTTETVKLEENPSEAPVTSSIETVKPEEKPSEEPMTPTTETVVSEGKPIESTVTEVTFPETNELPGQTETESQPEEPSTEKTVKSTSPSSEQEEPMQPEIPDAEHHLTTTGIPITEEKSTEKVIELEVTPTLVTQEQSNEEPAKMTEIPPETPTTVSSEAPISHAEELPGEQTTASIPTQEHTPESLPEIVPNPAVGEEVTHGHGTPESTSEPATVPAIISGESPASSEEPQEPVATDVGTEELQKGEPTEEKLPSSETPPPTSAIGDETPSGSTETEAPIEEHIATDASVADSSEPTPKLPIEEEKPEVSSELTPTEQQPESPTESSIHPVESTEQLAEEEPISSEGPEEMLPTTSGEFQPPGIPGEGNCLIDGESFTNNSAIPPANPCQMSCHCVSSIVQCELVQCPPPPSHLTNCMPIHIGSDACCPMYSCDAMPTAILESDNQMAGHPAPEEQGQQQETEPPTMSETPAVSKVPEQQSQLPEEHTTARVIVEESTPSVPETSNTDVPVINVPAEEPSSVAPESSDSSEKTQTPTIITKEVTSEVGLSSTSPSVEEIAATKATEPTEQQTVPSLDNRVGESEGATTLHNEGILTEAEPTAVPQVPESEGGAEAAVTSEQYPSAPEEVQTESGMISTEGVKAPTTSTEVHDTLSSAAGAPAETEPSTEEAAMPTISIQKPVESEGVTSVTTESVIVEDKPAGASSEKPHEETELPENPIEVTTSSATEELPTKTVVTQESEVPVTEPEPTKAVTEISPPVEEQTVAPITPEPEMTIAPAGPGMASEPTGKTPAVSETEVPTAVDEHKEISVERTEVPQTEITKETPDVVLEHETVAEIPEEQSTADVIPEVTSQPSVISEEPADKSTETPTSAETETEPSKAEDIPASTEPIVPSESSFEPSSESPSLSSSMIPEAPEHHVTETSAEQTAKPALGESTEILSNESEVLTTASPTEIETETEVTGTPAIETSKPETEYVTATSLPAEKETEKVSEESEPTTASAAASEAPSTDSQAVGDETDKITEPTAATPVESGLSTEQVPTGKPEEAVEGIKSVTNVSSTEATVTETITTENTSGASSITEESTETQFQPVEQTPSQDVNVTVVVTEKPNEEAETPFAEDSPTPAGPESSLKPETPSGEQPVPSEGPVTTGTDIFDEEKPTDNAEQITEMPVSSSEPSRIPDIVPVADEKPTEKVPVGEEEDTATEIKIGETPKPTLEEETTQVPEEEKSAEATSSGGLTPSTTSSGILDSSTQSQGVSPTISAPADEKSTEITTQQTERPNETDATASAETITPLTFDEITTQAVVESSSEITRAPIIPVVSEDTPATESKPVEEPEHTISPEVNSAEPVDEATSAPSPSKPTEDDRENQVPESPMISEHHIETEGQQTISPIEPEIVQEHVTESDKNLTSPQHTYIPPSSTESPTGGEYPEQTVSGEDNPHFPVHGGTHLNPDEDYEEDDQAVYGPGTCRYGGKVYVSAQQIPRDDPCDFCFCFRSDIICLQQSCPPPIPGCHEEPIGGFCCPRYECPVSMATSLNITTTTTTTTTTLPPHFLSHAYKGATRRSGCQIKGQAYKVGQVIHSASGPCLHCTCGGDGNMKCEPRVCTPEPMIRQMIAAATAKRRR